MGTDSGGVSRRRVLIGTAWTAPVILVATSVPARAASLPGGGVEFTAFSAYRNDNFWNSTAAESIVAIVVSANVQNNPETGGGTVPDATTMEMTYKIPVGTITNPAWGIMSNYAYGDEHAAATDWTRVSGPTVVDGVATLVISYGGDPVGTYVNKYVSVWIAATTDPITTSISATIAAVHEGSYTSSDARTATVSLIVPVTNPWPDYESPPA